MRRTVRRALGTHVGGLTVDSTVAAVRWLIDGNNVFGSRPDGWWNNRTAAATRLTQHVAAWCRDLVDGDVTLVFDAPLDASVIELGGGNLTVVESRRRGRDAADHHIVMLASGWVDAGEDADAPRVTVVSSDKGLRQRLPDTVCVSGVGAFRELIGY